MNANAHAFAGLSDMLGNGFDASLTSDAVDIPSLALELIDIVEQEREEFEDDENSLRELGESMRSTHQWQQIVVRPVDGRDKPYELVAGERRYRAATLVGMAALRAYCVPMSDEEAADARFAENIQRKNLTQFEEAKRLKRDVDQLGVSATLAKHHKSQAWLSKRLQLLELPEHTRRLVTENVSADIELIHRVRQIETVDAQAAKALVSDLKATRGTNRARDKVTKVKDTVKPGKRKSTEPRRLTDTKPSRSNTEGSLATAPDRSAEAAGPVEHTIFARAKKSPPDTFEPIDDPLDDLMANGIEAPPCALDKAYLLIAETGIAPSDVLADMGQAEREHCEEWLRTYYDAGVHSKSLAHTVLLGLRRRTFADRGPGAIALAAFLNGADLDSTFVLLNVLGAIKPGANAIDAPQDFRAGEKAAI